MPVFHGSTIGLGTVLFTPSADGAISQFMRTNGAGVLSFADGGGGGSPGGSADDIQINDGAGGFTGGLGTLTSDGLRIDTVFNNPASSKTSATFVNTINGASPAANSGATLAMLLNPGVGETIGTNFQSVQSTQAYVSGSGTITQINGNDARLHATATSTNIGSYMGFYVRNPVLTSYTGTITNYYGYYVDDIGEAGVTNAYGLYMEDIANADTLNYAIYTNAGLVRFGGNVSALGYIDTQIFTATNQRFGFEAGEALTTGSHSNTLVGYQTGKAMTGGNRNTFVGTSVGDSATSPLVNTGVGFNALGALTGGIGNTTLGAYAGDGITSGDNNTIVGYQCDVHSNSANGVVMLGHNITSSEAPSLLIGDSTALWLYGDTGYNISIPAGTLSVSGMETDEVGLTITGANLQTAGYLDINSFGNTGGDVFKIASDGTLSVGGGPSLSALDANTSGITAASGTHLHLISGGNNKSIWVYADDLRARFFSDADTGLGAMAIYPMEDYAGLRIYGFDDVSDEYADLHIDDNGNAILDSAGISASTSLILAKAQGTVVIGDVGAGTNVADFAVTGIGFDRSVTFNTGANLILDGNGTATGSYPLEFQCTGTYTGGLAIQHFDGRPYLDMWAGTAGPRIRMSATSSIGGAGATIFATQSGGLYHLKFGDKDGSPRYEIGVGGAITAVHQWYGDASQLNMTLSSKGEFETTLSDATGIGWTLTGANTQTGNFIEINSFGVSGGDIMRLDSSGVLKFGTNGNAGVSHFGDSTLDLYASGSAQWNASTSLFGPANGLTGAALKLGTPSLTDPHLLPDSRDTNTGVGGNNSDSVSLVAGGVNVLQSTTTQVTVSQNAKFSKFIERSATTGITASTTQSQGQQQLTTEINEIATVANTNDVVTLPAAVAGRFVWLINNGANQLQIYPDTGDAIDGQSVNVSVTLGAGSKMGWYAYDSTNWEAQF